MAKKPIVQGGVDNYLGKQPQVVAPRKWQSAPDKPETELAYITKAEKDLIIKKNIHGGLERGPNMGPSGIMSLDSLEMLVEQELVVEIRLQAEELTKVQVFLVKDLGKVIEILINKKQMKELHYK